MADGWTEYGKSWDAFQHEFTEADRIGMEIALEDGAVYLIGAINGEGGVCDCCSCIYNSGTVVMRYRRWMPTA